ncbi:glycosyltransferase [Nakamurella antarctica]|uniref:Glycosyltransferase n=1 Tax=Nakamurella antarctica TaxID=1902245 RepID=A0A3G8ZNZ8_9ACTN|nr:glycosyltransferase [Nakamurella antarctica]AZI58527.1 glycosyltransferase [Nakamurella antarctica]
MSDAVTQNAPLVSVVLLNFRGADDTVAAIEALRLLNWPTQSLEIICVDNASGDDSVTRIRAAFPDVRLIESKTNTGFTGGCNLGAREATGSYVAFLNNDAKPHEDWLRTAIPELENHADVGAVACKVLSWDGSVVDYVGGDLTWYGMGYKKEVNQPDDVGWNTGKDVLFGTGAALITRRDLFLSTGGFDERFFMFFEDVDYGWRLNLLGWRVRYVPSSLVFHRHHASMKSFGNYHEDFLLDRNALMTIYKNFSDATLAAALPGALALTARRAVVRGGLDSESLDLRRAAEHVGEDVTVPKTALAGLFAVDSFVENLADLTRTRVELQSSRKRSDADLMRLFGDSMRSMQSDARTLQGYQSIVEAFGVADHLQQRRRILIVTGDRLSKQMAGPAIRAWHIATLLGAEHDVRLVSTSFVDVVSPIFDVDLAPVHNTRSMDKHVQWADIIMFQGYALSQYSALQKTDKIMICDLYDPMHLEQLEQARELAPEQWRNVVSSATDVLNMQLRRGDFFLCASDRQRHFWLGQLAAVGRINPDNYAVDESLDQLIDIAPFGLTTEAPVQTRHALKGTFDGINADDKVVIWGGGVYNWFDPQTLVKAVGELAERRGNIRLVFLGMKHPNPHVPQMRAANEARALADSLGLTGKNVFFNEIWVDYDDRHNYLLDSDAGVTTHFDHVETTFSFRTRILDYLWAGLPIVTTGGDSFGELVREKGLGIAVSAENVTELAEALEIVLYDEEFAKRVKDNISSLRDQYTWEHALTPLLEFCRDPRPAPDRISGAALAWPTSKQHYKPNLSTDLALLKMYLKAGGVRELATRIVGRLKRTSLKLLSR